MRWWETEGRRHAGMKRVKSERMGVYALFAIVVLASASGNLSQTAVNAMLGDIMLQFGLTVDLGQWLTTSYMLVLGITVPVATFLSRRFSVRQHVFIALAFFLVGALADLFAPNFGVLLAGRVFQAISTGMLMPLMQTIAMTRFPRGRQATAMGVAGIAMGFAPNIGPTIGGAMSFSLGWRSFFVLLVVIMLALAAAAAVAIKPSAAPDKSARLDVVSLAQSTLGFGGLLLAFSNASSFSFESPFIWAPLVLGALFLVLFVRRQKRVDDPLISMDIFSSRQYRAGFIAQNLLNASFMGVTLIVPLYVEGLCGGTALEAGVVLLPGTVAALVLNPLAGVLTDKVGVRPVGRVSGDRRGAHVVSRCGHAVVCDHVVPGRACGGRVGAGGAAHVVEPRAAAAAYRGRRLVVLHLGPPSVRVAGHVGHGVPHRGGRRVCGGAREPRAGLPAGLRLLRRHGRGHPGLHRGEGTLAAKHARSQRAEPCAAHHRPKNTSQVRKPCFTGNDALSRFA